MRWMSVEVFAAGQQADPYPPGTAVLRRMRATPLETSPWTTWLTPSVNGIRAWRSIADRRADSVIGHAWVRRRALRRRRAAWSVWGALLAATAVWPWSPWPDPSADVSVAEVVLVGLGLVALLLAAARVRAVIDPADGQVGIRS